MKVLTQRFGRSSIVTVVDDAIDDNGAIDDDPYDHVANVTTVDWFHIRGPIWAQIRQVRQITIAHLRSH